MDEDLDGTDGSNRRLGATARYHSTPIHDIGVWRLSRRRYVIRPETRGDERGARRACDGSLLLAAFRRGVANLEAHIEEINALNVFPIPDGDTGWNMVATARAALDEAERSADDSAERIAAALSLGALRGARGNSGVILSQVVRGFATGLAGKAAWTPRDIAFALTEASRTADASVARPVEGTILTVVRASAEAAVAAAESDAPLPGVVEAAVVAADRAVDETPSLLPVLRDAGVVDSGGHGFYRLLEGIAQQLAGVGVGAHARPRPERTPAGGKPVVQLRDVTDHANGEPDRGEGYETIFLVEADARPLDVVAIRDRLNELGESVVVAGDEREARAHIHSPLPEPVVAYAMTLGRVSRMTVERLDEPAFGETEAAGGGAGGASNGAASGASIELVRRERAVVRSFERDGSVCVAEGGPAIVAVASGEGFAELMRHDFEVTSIVRPGPTQKPSAGELLAAVEMAGAPGTIIVTNDSNVLLAARQVAALAPRPVDVVPSRNAAEGFAALLAYDPSHSLEENVERMSAAAGAVRSFVVTTAVRDAVIDGREVHAGDTLAIDASERLAGLSVGPDDAILEALGASGSFELVTLYAGSAAEPAAVDELAARIRIAFADAEVEIIPGGQPFHRFLVAVE